MALGLLATTLASCQPAPLVVSNCDDAQAWVGGTLDTANVKEGTGAILWEHGKSDALRLRQVPADWSPYNRLSFWLYSPKATRARFMLIIPSENAAVEGMDYYSAAIRVDFEGWKRLSFVIPDGLGVARQPRGWNQIDGLYFTASGWDNTPDPNTSVTVDDIRLTWEEPPVGPLMTDEELFAALDLDYPGLEATKTAVQAGDLKAAVAAFARHLRTRTQPKHFINPADMPTPDKRPAKPNTSAADLALTHTYNVVGTPLQFADQINWKANPTEPFNPEWTWQFGRFGWWGSLGRAYWDTGDEKYAQEFVWELRSWIHDNVRPDSVDNGIGSRWRTIECGIRLAGSWPDAFYRFLPSPSFTDEDIVRMVKSFAEQAEYLYRYPTGGNWLTMEANGMGHVGVLFPEFRRAATWREEAIRRLHVELDNQVYPDGAQKELATGYHYVALNNMLGLARICMLNQIALPDDYIAKLERMWEYGLWVMMPDRTTPDVNDGGRVNVPNTLRQALEYFPGRQDFRWIATDGKEGTPPADTSHFFPWAGWGVMRSGWARDDRYLWFDVAPFGMGHQHEDKLSFLIFAYGKYLLLDIGNYTYDRSKMRSYVVGPYAHNIVFVDGQAQNRRRLRETNVATVPQEGVWDSTAAFDYCEGVYDNGFGPGNGLKVTHRRQVLFVKPDYWVVLDTLSPPDEAQHQYQALFHLGTEDATAEGAQVRTIGAEANLGIYACGPQGLSAEIVKGQEEPYYLGWAPRGMNDRRPIPVARYSWASTGVSQVLYVLLPSAPGEAQPQVATPAGETGLALRVDFPGGRQDTIRVTVGEGGRQTWEVLSTAAPGGEVQQLIRLEK